MRASLRCPAILGLTARAAILSRGRVAQALAAVTFRGRAYGRRPHSRGNDAMSRAGERLIAAAKEARDIVRDDCIAKEVARIAEEIDAEIFERASRCISSERRVRYARHVLAVRRRRHRILARMRLRGALS